MDNNRKMMDQTVDSIENYLVNMRQVSDAAYYDVIKENDIREQNESIHKGLNLLYEANKENLRSIAIYNGYGSLMAAEPVVAQKEEPDVTRQGWFMQAKHVWRISIFPHPMSRIYLMTVPVGITG